MYNLNKIKAGLLLLMLCTSLFLYGCGSTKQVIDYGDAEAFEAALNAGENLEGKIVQFEAVEIHPDSKLGYNVCAGEKLNFISSRNPDVKVGDTVIVKTDSIENLLGSWIINYEKVDNAVIGETTITSEKSNKNNETESAEQDQSASESKDISASEKSPAEKEDKNESSIASEAAEETTESSAAAEPSEATTESGAVAEPSEATTENTYEHNVYYDIVEAVSYKDSIGYTHLIHKVLAKKNVSVSATIIAYGADNSVIGKASDDITLTEGKNNFFHYTFESDISNAKFNVNATPKEDSFLSGERNAVELTDYNRSGDSLYLTFQQTGDNLSAFAKFKILFYKEDQIVDTEYSFFSTSTQNLNGKGSTDVAEVWVWGKDFDRIEYIFEP